VLRQDRTNSHNSVEQFLLSNCVITACLRALHSKTSGPQPFCWREPNPDLWFCESRTKKI